MSAFVEHLRRDLEEIRATLVDTLARVDAALTALAGETIDRSEAPVPVEAGGVPVVPAPDLPVPEPEAKPRKRRTIGLSEVRDRVVGRDVPVRASTLALELSITKKKAIEMADLLVQQGIVVRKGQEKDPAYQYVPPDPSQNPTHRPRGERMPPEVGALRKGGGDVVPLTGKPKGPSGRPGRDKKAAALGHRVKRARQGT